MSRYIDKKKALTLIDGRERIDETLFSVPTEVTRYKPTFENVIGYKLSEKAKKTLLEMPHLLSEAEKYRLSNDAINIALENPQLFYAAIVERDRNFPQLNLGCIILGMYIEECIDPEIAEVYMQEIESKQSLLNREIGTRNITQLRICRVKGRPLSIERSKKLDPNLAFSRYRDKKQDLLYKNSQALDNIAKLLEETRE